MKLRLLMLTIVLVFYPQRVIHSSPSMNCRDFAKQDDLSGTRPQPPIMKHSSSATWRMQKPRPLNQWPMECEGAEARLDFAVIDAKKSEESYLIVVSRLGSGEKSSALNNKRLAIIKEYILRRGTELKYVLASGGRVKGLGRVELYVNGRLKDVLPYKKNAISHCAQ